MRIVQLILCLIPCAAFYFIHNNVGYVVSIIFTTCLIIWSIIATISSLDEDCNQEDECGFYWTMNQFLKDRKEYCFKITTRENNYKRFLEESLF